MRDLKTFLRDITVKPMVLFPLIGLFQFCMWLYVVWTNIKGVFQPIEIAWITGFTFFWIFISDMRKWATWGYLALTVIDILLYAIFRSEPFMAARYVSSMFPMDVLFSFFVLFFYKKFE